MTHNCTATQNCVDTEGSFDCFCKSGYFFDTAANDCIDVNECDLKIDNCSENAECHNDDGGYSKGLK